MLSSSLPAPVTTTTRPTSTTPSLNPSTLHHPVLLYLYSFFCHCSIKRLLNAFASMAYTDSCDCFANYITNMNYNIRHTVFSINCKNCSIGCPYNLFLRFPPLRVGAAFSSLAFSTPVIWCRVFQSRVFSHPNLWHSLHSLPPAIIKTKHFIKI